MSRDGNMMVGAEKSSLNIAKPPMKRGEKHDQNISIFPRPDVRFTGCQFQPVCEILGIAGVEGNGQTELS